MVELEQAQSALTPDSFMAERAQTRSAAPDLDPDSFMAERQAKPSETLIQPEVADAETTNLARALIRPIIPGIGQAPEPPQPPLPGALAPDPPAGQVVGYNPRTGAPWRLGGYNPETSRGPFSVLDGPTRGVPAMARGTEQIAGAQSGRDVAGGLHQIIGGAFDTASPLMAVGGATAPMGTAVGVGAGMASQWAIEAGLKKLGLPPEYAAVAGDLGGVLAGAATGSGLSKIRAKVAPILKARFAKSEAKPAAPEQQYTSTGEPIRTAGVTPELNPDSFMAQRAPNQTVEEKTNAEQNQQPAGQSQSAPQAGAGQQTEDTSRRPAAIPQPGPSAGGAGNGPGADASAQVEQRLGARLPGRLAGAKPNYNYGSKAFTLKFASDVDRAAYITAQKKLSKADGDYLNFVIRNTGLTEREIRPRGAEIRDTIKQLAKGAEPGELQVPRHDYLWPRRAVAATEVTVPQPPPAAAAAVKIEGPDERPTETTEPVDAGAARGRGGVYGTGTPGAGRVAGAETEIVVPGEDRSLQSRYEVRELADVQPSHNGLTFLPNEKYAHHNERDYSKPENQGRVIQQSSEEGFNPRYHITDNPDATNGPPVIDERGNALGGNNRAMGLQRVYAANGRGAAAYRALLERQAAHFGIDPEAVRGMKQPVLLRTVPDSELHNLPGGAEWAIRKTNVSGTAALSASERAAADSRQLSPDLFHLLAEAMDDAGPESTLNDALSGRTGTRIVNRMIADGFFSEQERPVLMDGKTGALTQLAKQRIGQALLGKFFRNADQIARTPAALRGKLERIAAPLAKLAGNPEFDVRPDIADAIDAMEYKRAKGFPTYEDALSQAGMFSGEQNPVTPRSAYFARLIEDFKPNELVEIMRGYARNSVPETGMFGSYEPTPEQAMSDAVKSAVEGQEASAVKKVNEKIEGLERAAASDQNALFGGAVRNLPLEKSQEERAATVAAFAAKQWDLAQRATAAYAVERPGATPAEIGPHGPIYRQFAGKPAEGLAWIRQQKRGFAADVIPHPAGAIGLPYGNAGDAATGRVGLGVAHIDQDHEGWLDKHVGEIAHWPVVEVIPDGAGRVVGRVLADGKGNRAVVSLDWKGQRHPEWLLTGYEREAPASGTSVGVPEARKGAGPTPPATGDHIEPPTGGSALVPGSPQTSEGGGHPPPGGSGPLSPEGNSGAAPDTSIAAGDDQGNQTSTEGPTYMGSGLGALEPFFRESKAEGDALRTRRNEALAAAKKAADTPAEKKAGEKVRAYFTAERDLWAARTNQAIDVVTRKILPKIEDREALAIAREFRHQPLELQAFIDGTHPFLQDVNGGAAEADKNLAPIRSLLLQAQRILSKPTTRERTADRVFTNIAERDLAEGRAGGWLESRWQSDQYVPHALNQKGEGEVAKAPSTEGKLMGQVGKWFGFGERRSDRYPTMVHAVADGLIPKTLDPSAAFTVHADQFARARATHLLEEHLADSGLGKWGDKTSAPVGWTQLAAHSDEFKKRTPFAVPNSFDPETGESELRVGTTGLYVPPFIAQAMSSITDPDFGNKYSGFARLRTAQRGLKEAILGLSGYHLLTENFMAAADIGPTGMTRALRVERDSPAFLADERDLIGAGGTTTIQGSAIDAYRGLRPGTIPTRAEVVRAYIPGSKQALAAADAVTRFTFDNIQRRFKVTAFGLHRDAWMKDNPGASDEQLAEAKKGIASYVNGVYGGLHWENMGISHAMVEAGRAVFLAPDWSGSNIALAKYAADSRVTAGELPFRQRLAGAGTKEDAQARLARTFWTKQLVGGLAATQMLSLMFSGKLSPRPFQVHMGTDKNGEEVYQNVAFRGSIGDAVNLTGKLEDHVKEGYDKSGLLGVFGGMLTGAGVFVEGKLAPFTKLGMHVLTGRDEFGREITPTELATDVLPVPITMRAAQRQLFGDESDRYLWSERILSQFGPPGQHVAPTGMRLSAEGELVPRPGKADRAEGAAGKERTRLDHELVKSLREGKGVPADVAKARADGRLSRNDIAGAVRRSKLTPLQETFERMPIEAAIKVYGGATAAQKREIRGELVKKARAAMESGPPADRGKIAQELRGALAR